MKITRTMQHTPNLHALRQCPVEDEVIAESFHTPAAQILVAKFRPGTASEGILGQKLKAIVGSLQKAARNSLVVKANVSVDRLQIAEDEFAFLESTRHQQEAAMRSMLERSPERKAPRAASSNRVWMRGGVSDSSSIQRKSACRATSSASRYPAAICCSMKARIGSVSVTCI